MNTTPGGETQTIPALIRVEVKACTHNDYFDYQKHIQLYSSQLLAATNSRTQHEFSSLVEACRLNNNTMFLHVLIAYKLIQVLIPTCRIVFTRHDIFETTINGHVIKHVNGAFFCKKPDEELFWGILPETLTEFIVSIFGMILIM